MAKLYNEQILANVSEDALVSQSTIAREAGIARQSLYYRINQDMLPKPHQEVNTGFKTYRYWKKNEAIAIIKDIRATKRDSFI